MQQNTERKGEDAVAPFIITSAWSTLFFVNSVVTSSRACKFPRVASGARIQFPPSRRSGWLFVNSLHSSRSVSIPTPVYRRSRDPLITVVVIYRQEHIKRGRKRMKERKKRVRVCGFRLRGQVDSPGIGTYIHTYIRVHRTIDSPHFSGPSLRVRQFCMSFFPHFFIFFIYFAGRSTKSAASWTRPFVTGRIPTRARLQDFLMATACVPSMKNRRRRRTNKACASFRLLDYSKPIRFRWVEYSARLFKNSLIDCYVARRYYRIIIASRNLEVTEYNWMFIMVWNQFSRAGSKSNLDKTEFLV